MSSKHLGTILGTVPSATAKGETMNNELLNSKSSLSSAIEYTRIVASIPQTLKDEIKQYIRSNKGETETTVILRALKKMGFSVDSSWIVDKRTTR